MRKSDSPWRAISRFYSEWRPIAATLPAIAWNGGLDTCCKRANASAPLVAVALAMLLVSFSTAGRGQWLRDVLNHPEWLATSLDVETGLSADEAGSCRTWAYSCQCLQEPFGHGPSEPASICADPPGQ